jgi:hypothetical protein
LISQAFGQRVTRCQQQNAQIVVHVEPTGNTDRKILNPDLDSVFHVILP